MSYVFLSYAAEDLEIAARIAEAIKSVNVDVWIDEAEIRAGNLWKVDTEKAIRSAAAAVFVYSENSAYKDGYVQTELTYILEEDRNRRNQSGSPFVFPVVIDNFPIADHPLGDFHSVYIPSSKGVPRGKFVLSLADLLKAFEGFERLAQENSSSNIGRDKFKDAKLEFRRNQKQDLLEPGDPLFTADEMDIYCNKKTLETYVFYGKEIDLNIECVEYDETRMRARVIYQNGRRFDLGVKIQWLVRPYFSRASEIQFVRTKNREPIDGSIAPLFVVKPDGRKLNGEDVRGVNLRSLSLKRSILSEIKPRVGRLHSLLKRKR